MATTITQKDMDALLEGFAILGTAGGGDPEHGRTIMKKDFAMGRKYTIVDPSEVRDDSLVISGGYMGSTKLLGELSFEELVKGWEDRFELRESLEIMKAVKGRSPDYLVPFEIGGLNTPVILSLGARLGLPVVDGDGVGRAAPETQMCSFLGHGISLTPMPLVDRFGNSIVVWDSPDSTYADKIGRWVITRGGGEGANTHYAMSGEQLKRAVVPNTITKSLEIGNAVIAARKEGRDPVEAFTQCVGGMRIYSGKVCSIVEEEVEGFYFIRVGLTGSDPQSKFEMVLKNETMVCWKNGKLRAVFPDLVCLLEPKTGRGIMSSEIREHMEISVVGLPCHERVRESLSTPEGARAFSPERYGMSGIEYAPIETLAGD